MQTRRRIAPLWWAISAVLAVAVAAAALVFWTGTPVIGQSFTVGYVDMQKALDSHPRKAASERALQEFFQAKQREFQQRSRGMTPVQRQELDRQFQQQFLARREELFSGLDRDIRQAVEKVAKDRGISVVLDRTVVLYGGTDLTDAVIAQLSAK
ncbi:MAG: OmpH family outer membrane protein [Armatimonadota bacterium]|nr:OmpH family outer membrane protein [Armatimonadota bacterium]MDR7451362.1 OmpH family outer membrane protein [Armatimonadota bacterium]MDR7466488.1 OmpH family outer membrane protein [Armatimonadota bacterium]MDR7493210.1 OmpH family outer membrane protein [Armatimonadota bacterium]MDR7499437.1 OmpH family outer membrane protein [Armatimonadota bacterium]